MLLFDCSTHPITHKTLQRISSLSQWIHLKIINNFQSNCLWLARERDICRDPPCLLLQNGGGLHKIIAAIDSASFASFRLYMLILLNPEFVEKHKWLQHQHHLFNNNNNKLQHTKRATEKANRWKIMRPYLHRSQRHRAHQFHHYYYFEYNLHIDKSRWKFSYTTRILRRYSIYSSDVCTKVSCLICLGYIVLVLREFWYRPTRMCWLLIHDCWAMNLAACPEENSKVSVVIPELNQIIFLTWVPPQM